MPDYVAVYNDRLMKTGSANAAVATIVSTMVAEMKMELVKLTPIPDENDDPAKAILVAQATVERVVEGYSDRWRQFVRDAALSNIDPNGFVGYAAEFEEWRIANDKNNAKTPPAANEVGSEDV